MRGYSLPPETFKGVTGKEVVGDNDAPNALVNSGSNDVSPVFLPFKHVNGFRSKIILRDESRVKVESPSSIANLGPGFDILGVAVTAFKDLIDVVVVPGDGEVEILAHGYSIPSGMGNAAYGVVEAFRKTFDLREVDITVKVVKGVPPSAGLGSSGATSAGTAYALMKALSLPLSSRDLALLAGEGEGWVTGTPHYDNVSASLLGGFVLLDLLTLTPIKVANDFGVWFSIVTLRMRESEGKTRKARSLLPTEVKLSTFVKQASATALIIQAIHSGDIKLFGRAVSSDLIAEPRRKELIPHYDELKRLALREGALGFQISGAGPSVFSIHEVEDEAVRVGGVLTDYLAREGVEAHYVVAKPSRNGVIPVGW